MDNQDFEKKIKSFESKLTDLQSKCSDAEKRCLVAEANLKNLQQTQTSLIKECESFANCPIDQVPAFLEKEEREIQEIISRLDSIDTEGEITPDIVNALSKLMEDFNILQEG